MTSLRAQTGSCAFPWELDLFPFLPALIIPYWSIDLLFVLAPFFIRSQFLLKQHLRRVTLGIGISGFFFLAFPLKLAFTRPEVGGWLRPFFSSLENFHNFYNCAPSLHIVLWVLLWPVYITPTRGLLRSAMVFWFALIGASTLFCWQHHIMDVVTGQLVGLLCLWAFPSVKFAKVQADPTRRVNSCRKIAIRYGFGSIALLVLTWVGWPSSVLLLWPASSLLIVALAYAGGGPTLLRKHRGLQLLGTSWLLGPYRLFARLSAHFFNQGRKPFLELKPGLLLGRRLSDGEAKSLLEVEAVVDLTVEYDECKEFLSKSYLNIGILDLTNPSIAQLEQALEFIESHSSCYVHCSLGRGRTSIVGAAYLIAQGITVAEAMDQIGKIRPDFVLGEGALALLEEFHTSRGNLGR